MKRYFWIFFSLALLISIPKKSISSPKDTVKVGFFMNTLYDISFPENEFSSTFWIWLLYKNDSLKMYDYLELINSKSYDVADLIIEKEEGINWISILYNATVIKEWKTENFPFDKQQLKIRIEDAQYGTEDVVLVGDNESSRLSSEIKLRGWNIADFYLKTGISVYETNYGDPTMKENKSEYSHVDIIIDLERESWGLFFKLFLGVFVAFAISMLTFLFEPSDLDPRFGLSVGALFAAVGNKYVVDSMLPESAGFSLADAIHAVAFIFIFLSILASAISRHYDREEKAHISDRIDRYSLIGMSIAYTVINTYIIWQAQ